MYYWQRSIKYLTGGGECAILIEPLLNCGPRRLSHPTPRTACPLVEPYVFPGKGILVLERGGLFFGLLQYLSLS